MKLFLSDLDNTLIYSHRRDIGAKKLNVEWYEGRQISFMTERTRQLLQQVQQKLLFVPCTTRSMAQYQRITLLPDWQPTDALVANGGILLHHGTVDAAWYAESLERYQSVRDAMEEARQLLEQLPDRLLPVTLVDELFLFTKPAEPELVQQQLQQRLVDAPVQVMLQGQKLYVVPKTLTKGVAVQRMRQRYPDAMIYAAGDSVFDVPMLLAADFAYAPAELRVALQGQPQALLVEAEDALFSEALLEDLLRQMETSVDLT